VQFLIRTIIGQTLFTLQSNSTLLDSIPVSLEGRGGEGFGGSEIERKLEKSFIFFEIFFFL
jgi:hypothetical protein